MPATIQPPRQVRPVPTDINDWSNTAMVTIASFLGMVPEVGSLLNGLVYILWPSDQQDVWDQIKDQVQQLIDQDLTELIKNLENQTLQGLKNDIGDYEDAIATQDSSNISTNWRSANQNFGLSIPQFQVADYEVALLPYFAQAVNLHLALLRDGVLHGKDWGWTDADVFSAKQQLVDAIDQYNQYVGDTFNQENQKRFDAFSNAERDYLVFCANNPPMDYSLGIHYNVTAWNAYNNFVQYMTLHVLDFWKMWPSFSGGPVQVVLDREIYSAACGSSDYAVIPGTPWSSMPTQPISQIEVFAGDRIDGILLTYPAGGGPNGQTQVVAGKITDSGDTHTTFATAVNPLVGVSVWFGDVVGALQCDSSDGTFTNVGRDIPSSKNTWYLPAPPGEIISSVYINGTDQSYQSANLIIFGYQYQRKTTADLTALRHLYVVSPSEIDLSQLAARCVTKPVSIDALTKAAKREGWDAQRQQYRNTVKRRRTAAKPPRRAS